MADPIRVLLSQTTFNTDGVTTVWNFSFSGGYLDQTHVKAQRRDTSTGAVTAITLTPAMFTGPYQLTLSPALAVGQELTIYRATPKEGPLVDFTDRAKLTEVSLDYSAKQAIFGGAEADDWRMVVSAAIEAVNVYQAAIATGPVASVNGRTGSVVLAKADVGLANADNTSDADKPVSTAQASAIAAAVRGPHFIAAPADNQAVGAGGFVKLNYAAEVVDAGGYYNSATSSFTPLVAGAYLVTANVVLDANPSLILSVFRNGTEYHRGFQTSAATTAALSVVVSMNGTTDTIDIRAFLGSGANATAAAVSFTATLVRPA